MVAIAIRALDYRMGNEESVMLVKALGRANELLTGAFFAHQPWSAQRVLDRRSSLDKFRWSQTISSFFRKTQRVEVENHHEALGSVQEMFMRRLPRFLGRQRETRREEYCGG